MCHFGAVQLGLRAKEPDDEDAQLIQRVATLGRVIDEVQKLRLGLFGDVLFQLKKVVQLAILDTL